MDKTPKEIYQNIPEKYKFIIPVFFWIFIICIIVLIVQVIVQFSFTNTKRFSAEAYFVNTSVVVGIYLCIRFKTPAWVLLPILVYLLFLVIKICWGQPQTYLTTEFLYNDYFEISSVGSACTEYYTEGFYKNISGITGITGLSYLDTQDYSDTNVENIQKWCLDEYMSAVYSQPHTLSTKTMVDSQNSKYEWIVQNLNINKDSRVLEIGYGKLDLMMYIRDKTGATVEGANISSVHLAHGRASGFKCYQLGYDDLKDAKDKIGTFDVIITNGSLEYSRTGGLFNSNSQETYTRISQALFDLLNPHGLWFTTTIHHNMFRKNSKPWEILEGHRTFRNLKNLWALASGNEGGYPQAPVGVSKYAEECGFLVKLRQDRTLDYLVYSANWLACRMESRKALPWHKKLKMDSQHFAAWLVSPYYASSYSTFTPRKNPYDSPWLWQFLRQKDGWTPTTHYWIIFKKES